MPLLRHCRVLRLGQSEGFGDRRSWPVYQRRMIRVCFRPMAKVSRELARRRTRRRGSNLGKIDTQYRRIVLVDVLPLAGTVAGYLVNSNLLVPAGDGKDVGSGREGQV